MLDWLYKSLSLLHHDQHAHTVLVVYVLCSIYMSCCYTHWSLNYCHFIKPCSCQWCAFSIHMWLMRLILYEQLHSTKPYHPFLSTIPIKCLLSFFLGVILNCLLVIATCLSYVCKILRSLLLIMFLLLLLFINHSIYHSLLATFRCDCIMLIILSQPLRDRLCLFTHLLMMI